MNNKINKHWQFWLTFWSMISFISIFLFMMFTSIKEEIVFKKEYCLFLLPFLIYNMIQLVINYSDLTDND